MPYKRKYNKKRVYKKKRSRAAVRRPRYRPRAILSGFPSRKLVKMRYIDQTISLDPGTGIGFTSNHTFRCNGVFDPDFTGIGHQPMSYDQWATIYNKYTVVGAKITVKYQNDGTNKTPGWLGVTLSKDPASPATKFSSINNLLESKLTGMNIKQVGMIYPSQTSSRGVQGTQVTKSFSAKKFFGVTNVRDSDHLTSLVDTTPASPAYFHVFGCSIDGNNPGAINLLVQIDYIVLFTEPKTLNGS